MSTGRKTTDEIVVEFLFLDLTTCTRCVGTGRSLETALAVVHDVLAATGAAVEVRQILVETAEQARELRFLSSPTLRVNGRDVALELKESPCASEPCGCGCDDDTLCRAWTYRGQESTEAPVGLIVDAILAQVYGGSAWAERSDVEYELPPNLVAFFARQEETVEVSACCSPERQASCCDWAAKADCCAPSAVGSCSCQ